MVRTAQRVRSSLGACVVMVGALACGHDPAHEGSTGAPSTAVDQTNAASAVPVSRTASTATSNGATSSGSMATGTSSGVGSGTAPDRPAVGRAECPEPVVPGTQVSLEDPGIAPLAERAFSGRVPQSFTVRSTVDGRAANAGRESSVHLEDEFDVTAQRGADAAGVAPLWITLDGLRFGDRVLSGEVHPAAQRAAAAPQVGASICLLQGGSGLTILNSSTAVWGTDKEGVLQTLLSTQIIVFPPDPLGAGARWTRSATKDNDGNEERQEWSYQLTSVDEAGYEVHGTATHTTDRAAEAQSAQSIPMVGGDMVAVTRYEFTVVGRFDQPFPVSATITRHGTQQSASAQVDVSGTNTLVVTGR